MKLDATHNLIARARVRQFAGRSLLAASYALPAGAALAALAVFGRSLGLLAHDATVAGAIAAGALAAAGVVVYAALGISTRRVARLLDLRGDLKDRLTNALDFAARAKRSRLMELAIADAEAMAGDVRPAALMPLWSRAHTKRLATLLLILPILYGAAAVDLYSYFKKPRPEFAGALPPTVPAELAEDGFHDLPGAGLMLPALANLHGLIGDWRARLTELREKAREIEQIKEPELPKTIYREAPRGNAPPPPQTLGPDGLPMVRNTNRLHPSDARALGDVDPNVEGSLRTAFSQLDDQLLDQDPQLEALAQYAKKLHAMSDQTRNGGEELGNVMTGGASQAALASTGLASVSTLAPANKAAANKMATNALANGPNKAMQNLNMPKPSANMKSPANRVAQPAESDHQQSFRQSQASAQDQSYSEFMQQYAAHLARLIAAKEDTLAQKAANNANQPQNTLSADQGQQLPPSTQLRMVQPTEDMVRGVKLTSDVGAQLTPGDGRGAGEGGGTYRGAIKVKHEEKHAEGPLEGLKGQLGEGKSSVQILEDAEGGNTAPLAAMMRAFKADAEERLQDQTIPIDVRAYVQRYLQSLSSAGGAPPK